MWCIFRLRPQGGEYTIQPREVYARRPKLHFRSAQNSSTRHLGELERLTALEGMVGG